MGIGGLLPLLKEIQHAAHVREWAGKTVAVDGYVSRLLPLAHSSCSSRERVADYMYPAHRSGYIAARTAAPRTSPWASPRPSASASPLPLPLAGRAS